MAGYYRKFCKNFSEITAPLTELLKKGVKHHWSEACHKSFDKVKNLCLEPILSAPNLSKPFRLAVTPVMWVQVQFCCNVMMKISNIPFAIFQKNLIYTKRTTPQ